MFTYTPQIFHVIVTAIISLVLLQLSQRARGIGVWMGLTIGTFLFVFLFAVAAILLVIANW